MGFSSCCWLALGILLVLCDHYAYGHFNLDAFIMPSNSEIAILACQINVPPTETVEQRDAHTQRLCQLVSAQLDRHSVDLVLLPELASIDYSRNAFSKLPLLAEPLDGFSYQQWRQIAMDHQCSVAYSFPRLADSGDVFISVAVVGPNGQLLGHYDKIYLAQFGASMEKDYFVGGEHLFCFRVNDFTVGCIVCADIRYPEICRALSIDNGVDVILHPSAYSRDATFASWHSFAKTRALENQVYFLSLNRAGANYGNSVFFPPWVDDNLSATHFHAHDEHFCRLTLNKQALNYARENFPFVRDLNTLDLSKLAPNATDTTT